MLRDQSFLGSFVHSVVSFRPLELLPYCHVLDLGLIVIGLILGCAVILSKIFVQLAYFEI